MLYRRFSSFLSVIGTTHLIRFSCWCLWLAVEVEAGMVDRMVGGEMIDELDDAEIGTQFQMCGCQ